MLIVKSLYFFLFSIKTSKCSGSCNNINNPYSKLCVPDVNKNLDVKFFNLMSKTNETRYIKWHETCKYTCRLGASACANKQRWNEDKCMCEYKELIDIDLCNKEFIWIPSNCECECDKSFDNGEYLDYENCKCRKNLVDKVIEEFTEKIVEKITEITQDENKRSSCTLYIVLFWLFFIFSVINIGIGIYFTYKYMILNKTNLKNDGTYQTTKLLNL